MKTIKFLFILLLAQAAHAEYEIYMERGFAKVDEIISSTTNENGSHTITVNNNGKIEKYENVKEIKEVNKKNEETHEEIFKGSNNSLVNYVMKRDKDGKLYADFTDEKKKEIKSRYAKFWKERSKYIQKNIYSYYDFDNICSSYINNNWWMKDTYEITPFHNYEITGYYSGGYVETIYPVLYNPYYDPYMSQRIQRHYSNYIFDTYHIGTDEHGCYYEPVLNKNKKLGFNF